METNPTIIIYSFTSATQGGYDGPCVVGDFRQQMAGILNISHLLMISWGAKFP